MKKQYSSRRYHEKHRERLKRCAWEYRQTHLNELRRQSNEKGRLTYDWMVYMLGNKCEWCGSNEDLKSRSCETFR